MLKYIFMPYRASKHSGVSGAYSVVTNHGHGGKAIFRSPSDLTHFTTTLKRLARQSPAVEVVAFCVLTNSFHLVLRGLEADAVSKFMHRLSVSYSIYFNGRYDSTGKVFAGPYKDKLTPEGDTLVRELCRIHLLPALQRQDPETYTWSSYRYYLTGQGTWINKFEVTRFFGSASFAKDLKHFTDSTALPTNTRL